jgi:DNA (cytosine-5)-methyltransferase 1
MKINKEIDEIVKHIRAFQLPLKNNDFNYCLNQLTAKIDEDFLMTRANDMRESFETNSEFKEALKCLSSICNEKTQDCENCPVKKYCNSYIRNKRSLVNDDSLKMVDLFCGAGGLSLGFSQNGFVTCLANDIQDVCVDTYAHNHPETPRNRIILGDIKEMVVNQINTLFKDIKVDIVVGGPPCQGFSMANRQRLIDDPRNKLYKNFVHIVDEIKPSFFVMENVKGMLSVKNQVIEDFNNIGYSVSAHILNAKDFGVPQNRERLIYIGNRFNVNNEDIFSKILELSKSIPDTVLKDALFGLRKLEALRIKNATDLETEESGRLIEHNNCKELNSYVSYINQGKIYPAVLNHKARYNNDRDIEIFRRLNPGDKSTDPKIADIMPYTRRNDIFKDKYFKLEPNKVCKTITAHMKFDCNMYIHPYEARGLTPREAARVQSYPDDYFFRGSYTKTYMQIGNSVPPLLGRAIATVIKDYVIQYHNK